MNTVLFPLTDKENAAQKCLRLSEEHMVMRGAGSLASSPRDSALHGQARPAPLPAEAAGLQTQSRGLPLGSLGITGRPRVPPASRGMLGFTPHQLHTPGKAQAGFCIPFLLIREGEVDRGAHRVWSSLGGRVNTASMLLRATLEETKGGIVSPQHQLLDHGSVEGDPARGWTTAPPLPLVSLLEACS